MIKFGVKGIKQVFCFGQVTVSVSGLHLDKAHLSDLIRK